MKQNLIILIIILAVVVSFESQTPSKDTIAEEVNKMEVEVVRLFKEGKYNEALPIAKKVVEVTEKKYGSGAIELARAYSNLGYVQYYLSESKSENTFEKAANIYKKLQNPEKKDIEDLVNILERIAISKQKRVFIDAESSLEEAAVWREKVSGSEAKELVSTYFLLANISYWKKDYQKSADRYYKVLDLVEKNRNITNEEAKMAYYRCRCSFRKAGKEDQLVDLQQKFLLNKNSMVGSELVGKTGAVLNGVALNLVKPPYPQEAKTERAQGTVAVEVLIGKTGKVLSACGSNKVHQSLIESAEIAALNSTFSPTIVGGNPVNTTGTIVYNFTAR